MPRSKKPKAPTKVTVTLAEGGPSIECDISPVQILGIHKVAFGYGLTHLATGRLVVSTRLKREAVELRRRLEVLDWGDLEAVEAALPPSDGGQGVSTSEDNVEQIGNIGVTSE